MDKQSLLNLQDKINTAKEEVSKLEGKKELLQAQLKEQFNCDSVEDADKLVKKLETKITNLDASIKEGIKGLKEKYEIDDED